MSIRVTQNIWEYSAQEKASLLVLLALADRADDDGVCWPGYDYLAAKARILKRSVIRIIQRLVATGELIIARDGGGSRNTNQYLITVGFDHVHLINVLVRRFSWPIEDATEAVTISKGDSTDTVANSDSTVTLLLEKGDSPAQKGDSPAQKGCPGSHPIRHDPSKIRQRGGKVPLPPKAPTPAAITPSPPKSKNKDLQRANDNLTALLSICAISDLATDRVLEPARVAAGRLASYGATPDQIREFKNKYWWGKRPPTPTQVLDEWGSYEDCINGQADQPEGFRVTQNINNTDDLKAAIAATEAKHATSTSGYVYVEPEPPQYQPTQAEKERIAENNFRDKQIQALAMMKKIADGRQMDGVRVNR